ncbi:hypothetical protein IAR50_007360 [Cryptococcus sp. DSM 104548]
MIGNSLRLFIQALYKSLHSVRVVHGGIKPRHIRRRADGSLCIIGFHHASLVSTDEGVDDKLKEQMEEVEDLLKLLV